jgi:imidazolonepropionase
VAQDIVPTYLGAHAVPPEHKAAQEEFVEYIINEMTPAVGRLGIARYCDVFCEEGVFTVGESRRILLGARAVGMRLKIHADELASSGGTRLGAELGVDTADHLLRSSREDLEALRDAGGIGVILPGTCLGLGKTSYAPGRLMTELGLPVALATDLNPGNCYCENFPLMITLGCLYAGLTVEQAVIGVTINAAYGVGMGDNIGSIELGKQGDLVAWDAQNYRELAYHFGTPLAALVVKKGSVVFHRQSGLR